MNKFLSKRTLIKIFSAFSVLLLFMYIVPRTFATGITNWERQLQKKLSNEFGLPEPTQPSDVDDSATAKIAVIQHELTTISSVRQEPEVEQ